MVSDVRVVCITKWQVRLYAVARFLEIYAFDNIAQ